MIPTVAGFLFALLKIILWLLLAIVLFVLVVVLLALFVPLRYLAEGKCKDFGGPPGRGSPPGQEIALDVKASWLLHFLHIVLHYDNDGLAAKIRVAGIDVQKLFASLAARRDRSRRRRQKKAGQKTASAEKSSGQETAAGHADSGQEAGQTGRVPTQEVEQTGHIPAQEAMQTGRVPTQEVEQTGGASTQESGQTGRVLAQESGQTGRASAQESGQTGRAPIQEVMQADDNGLAEEPQAKDDGLKKSKRRRGKKAEKKPGQGLGGKLAALRERGAGLRQKVHVFYTEATNTHNKHALTRAWSELCYLLRSYRPRKVHADLIFSLADPAATGLAVGGLSLLPLIYRQDCQIVPDFESDRLYVTGEILLSGHVGVWHVLVSLLRLFRDREVREALARRKKK